MEMGDGTTEVEAIYFQVLNDVKLSNLLAPTMVLQCFVSLMLLLVVLGFPLLCQ